MPPANGVLDRSSFTTSRLLEFFTQEELAMQIGHPMQRWHIALLKELIDNALDACDEASVAPRIEVSTLGDAITVQDNGPGLPLDVIERSIDYTVRVSNKANYVSPTRGQLGNALKCVWAAPFVLSGDRGLVEVTIRGLHHRIEVTLDRIAQKPHLDHTVRPTAVGKNGTFIKMHWPGLASLLDPEKDPGFYNGKRLIQAYGVFNPHAALNLTAAEAVRVVRTNSSWKRWLPSRPTSPHWYSRENLRALIAAYIAEEQREGGGRTLRRFVSEFHGLTGSRRPKAVLAKAGVTATRLSELVRGNDVHGAAVERLLQAMKEESRPVKPTALGVLGQEHLAGCLAQLFGVHQESVRYKRVADETEGLPFVLEVAFGIADAGLLAYREVLVGLNSSPALHVPFYELVTLLDEMRVGENDPVAVLVHLACPRLDFTDRGKSRLALPDAILEALGKCVRNVARAFKNEKRHADRDGRLYRRQLERLRRVGRSRETNIQAAAWEVMESAYLKASGNTQYPANARQIMYVARPDVLQLTGGKCWSKSSYFTQKLLPRFIDEHPALTADWDVVFDARGQMMEPHTEARVALGTLQVRDYVADWKPELDDDINVHLDHAFKTIGPVGRYRFALFIEKEGFNPLLKVAETAERYDLAIMSTKGMSVTACRHLVERLCERGITILVLHDLDCSGFSILHTLGADTPRYRFQSRPKIIDLGLRLEDAQGMDLQSEPVEYKRCKKDPRINLLRCGATQEEANLLVQEHTSETSWKGERVELNAMTSVQLIDFLARKFKEHGVAKVVPDKQMLEIAYRRDWRLAKLQEVIDHALLEIADEDDVKVPANLRRVIEKRIRGTNLPWDEAVWQLVREREIIKARERP